MFASTALLLFLCATPASAQTIRRRRSGGGIIGAVIAAVIIALILCFLCVMLRRRRTANARALATGTGNPLFGGLWHRRQAAPVTGTVGNRYGGNVTVPPPAYGRDGYVAYPPV